MILETYTTNMTTDFRLPTFLKIEQEITNDKRFSLYTLSVKSDGKRSARVSEADANFFLGWNIKMKVFLFFILYFFHTFKFFSPIFLSIFIRLVYVWRQNVDGFFLRIFKFFLLVWRQIVRFVGRITGDLHFFLLLRWLFFIPPQLYWFFF